MPAALAREPLGREKQRLLFEASRRYMSGEITGEDLDDAERRYMPNYKEAMLTLARVDRRHERGFRQMIRRLLGRV